MVSPKSGGNCDVVCADREHMFLQLYLQLHWNMIRLEGAEVLCNSLRTNRVLTNLDLSYNALGSAAAGVLGAALMENSVSGPTLCLAAYLTGFSMTATHQLSLSLVQSA